MNNVLVTGGAGFIGSNFVRYLLTNEPDLQVTNLDALTYAGSLANLNDLPGADRHTFVHGDICDLELVGDLLRSHQVDTIVHFAAETHVDRSIRNPELFVRTNIIGTHTLLQAARQYWQVERALDEKRVHFHHVSTDEVYGSLRPDEPSWTEDIPYAPNSPYAASKAASDHLVRAYGHTYQFPYTITNCSNNYGPYQFPEKLIPLMIANLLEGKPLPVYGDGGQIRDWLYVEDHCDAIWTVLRKSPPGQTYNIGGDNQPTNLTVVRTLCDILDELRPNSLFVPHQNLITFVKDRPGHDRRYAMDSTRIRQELGWRPRHSLETGLLDTARWYLAHSDWIEAVQQGSDYHEWIERNYKNREAT
jgi:dTDP-glucose 4,6-dehydratase